jgi:hypothetical protein
MGNFITKDNIIHSLFIMLSLALMIVSFLDIRSSNQNDSQDTIKAIKNINNCSYAILVLSSILFIRSIIYFYMTREGMKYNEPEIVEKVVFYVFPFMLMVTSIVQKAYISSILPDMDDEKAVNEYDSNHTLPASSVSGASTFLLILTIVLFLLSVGHFLYKKYFPEPPPPAPSPQIVQETEYDKTMRELKFLLQNKENDYNTVEKSGTASRDWLREKSNEIQDIKLAILTMSKGREEEVQKKLTQNVEETKKLKKALDEASSRHIEELAYEKQKGSINVEDIIPEHLKKQPSTIVIPKIITTQRSSSSSAKPSSSSTSSSLSSTFFPKDISSSLRDRMRSRDQLYQDQENPQIQFTTQVKPKDQQQEIKLKDSKDQTTPTGQETKNINQDTGNKEKQNDETPQVTLGNRFRSIREIRKFYL